MTSLRAGVFGLLSLIAFGCEGERVLGDLEGAGQGGDESGGTGGSSGTSTGGSPTGGTAQGGSTPTGGTAQGGSTPTGGTAQGGTAPNGGSGGGVPCFSPDSGVPPQFSNLVGCPCGDDDVPQCVANGTNPITLVGMVCDPDGRWILVADSPCNPGPEPWCMVENRVFRPGSEIPPNLTCKVCHACPMVDPVCLLIDCAPPPCEEGTAKGSRCRECGSPGGCAIMEHGCFEPCTDGERCEWGSCSNGACNAGPCI
jgi:hypothetical protein